EDGIAIGLTIGTIHIITSVRHDIAAYEEIEAGKTIATHLEALKWRKAQLLIIISHKTHLSRQTQYEIAHNALIPIRAELVFVILYPAIALSGCECTVIFIAQQ